jgi:hypothetical protein
VTRHGRMIARGPANEKPRSHILPA